jgi:hypothetical protein
VLFVNLRSGGGKAARAGTVRSRRSRLRRRRPGCRSSASRAGTRNHFAADLGVDRRDLVGALDAFGDGVERRIDIATVNAGCS